MPTRHNNHELLAELKALRAVVGESHTTVPNLIRRLGEPVDKVEGSGYHVHPKHTWFASVFVGIDADAGMIEKPTDVDIILRPEIKLRLADLDATFGKHAVGRPNRVFRFTYEYSAPEHDGQTVVLAYLRRDPSDPESRVEEIIIMRDE